jgi:hypothetical protein
LGFPRVFPRVSGGFRDFFGFQVFWGLRFFGVSSAPAGEKQNPHRLCVGSTRGCKNESEPISPGLKSVGNPKPEPELLSLAVQWLCH